MYNIIFRADGSSTSGLGHIMRCLALSEMIKKNFSMSFAVFDSDKKTLQLLSQHNLPIVELKSKDSQDYADSFDAVVLDGYWYDNSYIKALQKKDKKVVQIDDLSGSEFFAEIVINHAIGSNYSHAKFHNCKHLLVGSEYALLRKEFLGAKQVQRSHVKLESLTISMGGADPQNYTLKLLKLITKLNYNFKINVLIGSAFSHTLELIDFIQHTPGHFIEIEESLTAGELVKLLQNTSLFMCSCSTVVYEALAVKLPIACFLTAQNQLNLYSGLIKTKAVEGLGDLENLSTEELELKLSSVFLNYERITRGVAYQNCLIDGLSGERINNAIVSLWN